jgi:hypothetical protein
MTFRESDSSTTPEVSQLSAFAAGPKRKGRLPAPRAEPDEPVLEPVDLEETPALSEELLQASASPSEDPVRLYLKEIGKVSLLKAHEEVSIGQRIEVGQIALRRALGGIPLATARLLAMVDRVRHEELMLDEVILLPEGGEPEPEEGFTGFPSPCVADRCRIVIDRRFLIEEDLGQVKEEVRGMLEGIRARRPKFSYEIRDLHEVRPTMTDREAPVVRTVAGAIRKVLSKTPDYVVSPGTYDQKHIDRIGRLKNCIAYGPGVLDLAHQPDEWVGIDDMADAAKVMALTLAALLSPR